MCVIIYTVLRNFAKMRTINLIDFCGQLLKTIQKSHSPSDKITEYFFRQKRKIIGSKERKFISQIVFSTIRNFILIKNIAQNCNALEHLKHPKIFANSPEHSIFILVQILLTEIFNEDFPYFETSFFNCKHTPENIFFSCRHSALDAESPEFIEKLRNKPAMTVKEKPASKNYCKENIQQEKNNSKNSNFYVINSINSDLKIIENSEQFKNYLNNDFIESVKNSFSKSNENYQNEKSFYKQAKIIPTFNCLKNKELYNDIFNEKNNLTVEENFTVKNNLTAAKNIVKNISLRNSFPIEFLELLLSKSEKINLRNIFDFVEAMNVPAATCLRVNKTLSTVDEIIENLKENNIDSQKGNLSNSCIIVERRHQLTELADYKNGKFVIQDESSQLVAFCANPKSTDFILDACAGAGGKSLHLADLQSDCGKIIASDIEFMKIKEIPKRANLSNFKSIKTAICHSDGNIYFFKNPKPIKEKFDIVLVDAPCTGAGTLRRDPTKKYKITEKTLNKMSEIQYQILTNYSKFVRAGGFLLYSTCSIFSQENELVVERFLQENPDFTPEPIHQHFAENGIFISDLTVEDYCLTLFPHIHKTDGFFISKMRKI